MLPVVLKAEEEVLAETGKSINKEYAPVDGVTGLGPLTQELIFSKASKNIASSQTLSGTGSLRVAGEFIKTFLGVDKIYYSDPTWGNHIAIFNKAGIATEKYPYWNPETKSIRFDEFVAHLNNAPNGSLYLIHPSGGEK